MRLLRRALLLCVWLLAGLGSLRAVSLTHGPEVAVTPTNAVIRWTTDAEAGSRVAGRPARG